MSPTIYRIHTPRLVVRCWEPADAPQLMAAKNASKEHLLPWMPWALGEPSDLAANLALIRAWHAQFDTDQDYVYGIFNRETQPWWAAQDYMSGSAKTRERSATGFTWKPPTGGSPPRRPRR